MAPRNLAAHAKLLAALGVTSLALIAATAAKQADPAPIGGTATLALVDPHGADTYKAAAAEQYGNVVADRSESTYKAAQAEGLGNVVADRG
jgi:hypothetical protein